MSGAQEVTYELDFCANKRRQQRDAAARSPVDHHAASFSIPRIARLMALAIRFDTLLRAGEFRDYAELARLGNVTRARMTQIMKLLNLAPDVQERILFLPPTLRLNERNLRTIVRQIDWSEQRRMFQKIMEVPRAAEHPRRT